MSNWEVLNSWMRYCNRVRRYDFWEQPDDDFCGTVLNPYALKAATFKGSPRMNASPVGARTGESWEGPMGSSLDTRLKPNVVPD